jgi:perosamine synthetase
VSDDFIPVNEPLLDGNEGKYLRECVESGWISSEGPFVRKFEEKFASTIGVDHGIAVANGTGALDVAIAALGIGPGDEVILPAFTIISCVLEIVRSGATPVLVDSDPDTWNMDPEEVAKKITPRTRAIMVVHIYGLPVDMDPILAVARDRNIAVIEDSAEAIGQAYRGKTCGSFGDLATFSFYANKHVTTGEGGMVVTGSDALAEEARSLRNLCFTASRRFVHERLGWNYRMTNLQAAVGVAQLERLPETLAIKRKMGSQYQEQLQGAGFLQLPVDKTDYAENHYWVFGIVLDESLGLSASEFAKKLGSEGIGTRPFFYPMHLQPVLQRMGLFAGQRYPIAERLYEYGLYVPSGVAITESQVDRVCSVVRRLAR